MKIFRIIFLIGWGCLTVLNLQAQKKVPHSFQYTSEAKANGELKELTQVSYSGTSSIRLYFDQAQLGPNSYLLLEGSDGAQQKLDAQALKNWSNSSAYFNGQSVKVLIYQALGEKVTLRLKELSVNERLDDPTARKKNQAAKATEHQSSNAKIGEFNQTDMPWEAAVGRFTNGDQAFGTGWIAPNGAIVTSKVVLANILDFGYNIIEFNVPHSNEDGSVNHPEPQHQYPVEWGTVSASTYFLFKDHDGNNEPGLGISEYRTNWAIVEALPNGTGLRPGERQQQYFRIATNPGSFVTESKDIEVDLLYYGHHPVYKAYPEEYLTLWMTSTKLMSPKETISRIHNNNINREHMLVYHCPEHTPFSSAMGAPITYHQSNVAIGVHYTSYVHAPAGAIGFKNNSFRNNLNNLFTSNVVYVDAEGLYGDNSTGEIHKPYLDVEEGTNNASEHAAVFIAKGSYNESLIISTPMTLKAPVGVVKIGTSEGNNARNVQPSLSTELFANDGESLFEAWEDESAKSISLQSFPNPFVDRTELYYTLRKGVPVQVKVYDILGQEVHTLVQKEQSEGEHSVQWDGRNQQGQNMPTGLYIMQLKTGEKISAVRVMKQ